MGYRKSCVVLPKGTPEREGVSHLPLLILLPGTWMWCHLLWQLRQECQGHPGSGTVVKMHSWVTGDFMKPPQTTHHLQTSFTSESNNPSCWSHCFLLHGAILPTQGQGRQCCCTAEDLGGHYTSILSGRFKTTLVPSLFFLSAFTIAYVSRITSFKVFLYSSLFFPLFLHVPYS